MFKFLKIISTAPSLSLRQQQRNEIMKNFSNIVKLFFNSFPASFTAAHPGPAEGGAHSTHFPNAVKRFGKICALRNPAATRCI
ncbi:MAG: hypothetical protein HYZ21_10370 [Chloroflexi bacterium]|nr:hypothetical protein [Chloroflexota bacterium]